MYTGPIKNPTYDPRRLAREPRHANPQPCFQATEYPACVYRESACQESAYQESAYQVSAYQVSAYQVSICRIGSSALRGPALNAVPSVWAIGINAHCVISA